VFVDQWFSIFMLEGIFARPTNTNSLTKNKRRRNQNTPSPKNVQTQPVVIQKCWHRQFSQKTTDKQWRHSHCAQILFVMLRGKFDWISLVGEAAQHTLSLPHFKCGLARQSELFHIPQELGH
jgi:mannosyltransferase OCH1-like enzyme